MSLEGTIAQHRTVALVAGGGLLILAGIAAFDWLANRGKAQANASAATGSTAANGTSSPYNNSVTDINTFTDNSVTENQYNPPNRPPVPTPGRVGASTPPYVAPTVPASIVQTAHPAIVPTPELLGPPTPAPSNAGTLHPTSTPQRLYTVQPGDSLWAIAQHEYGIGADWTRIYSADYSTITAAQQAHGVYTPTANLIYPGERLTIPSLN